MSYVCTKFTDLFYVFICVFASVLSLLNYKLEGREAVLNNVCTVLSLNLNQMNKVKSSHL